MLTSLIALFLLTAILFAGFASSLAMAQQTGATTTTTTPSPTAPQPLTPPLTPQEQEQQNRLQNVIAATNQNLDEAEKEVNGIVYTPRWSEPVWINANSLAVLVAYCLPGEFADSGQEILGGFELEILESYAVALPQGFMAWMMVIGNEDRQNRHPAAVGVICASDVNNVETRVLSPDEQQQINNIVQQFTQVTNIEQVINIINNVTTTPPAQNETGGGGMTPPTTEQPLTVEIIPNATQGIAPAIFDFEANVTGGTPPYTYSWEHNDSDQKYPYKTFGLVVVKATTINVILTVTDSKNQTASDSIQIPVEAQVPPSAVEIIPNATQGIAPATFKFEMNGNPGSASREYWFWRLDFGDGTFEYHEKNERTVEHTFRRAGTYNVVLELHAFGGQTASDSIVITVEPRGPPGGVTVGPTEEGPPPIVPGEGGDTGRGPQGGVTVERTEEPTEEPTEEETLPAEEPEAPAEEAPAAEEEEVATPPANNEGGG